MSAPIFSIRVNNDLSPRQFARVAALAEASGFDQVWVSHDLLLHSALASLPVARLSTERIKLGIGIINPYTLHRLRWRCTSGHSVR